MEDLITSVLTGEATEQQKRRLEEWRNESPENERIYQEFAGTWESVLLFASQERAPTKATLREIVAAGNRRRQRAIPLKPSAARRGMNWWWVGTAAAAIIAVAVGVPFLRNAPPQLLLSVVVSTHAWPHKVVEGGHAHMPFRHSPPVGHLIPQPLQLL